MNAGRIGWPAHLLTTTCERAVFEMPLIADPGTRWEYGISTDWLGQVVEAASGMDLAAYCREHVFVPLGMGDTTFSPNEAQKARVMPIHSHARRRPRRDAARVAGGTGVLVRRRRRIHDRIGLSALHARDVARRRARRGSDLASGDRRSRLHRPPRRHRASRPHRVGGARAVERHPLLAGGAGIRPRLSPRARGHAGMRRAGTGDWAGLFNCYYWIDRTTGVAGALLTQLLPFFDARIVETSLAFEQAVYAEVGAPAAA